MAQGATTLLLALPAALVMIAVDARRRPVLAALAYGLTLFVAFGAALPRMPAFSEAVPSMRETVVAAVMAALAGSAGGLLTRWTSSSPTPSLGPAATKT